MPKGERQGKKYRVRRSYRTKKKVFKGKQLKEKSAEESEDSRPTPTPNIRVSQEVNITEIETISDTENIEISASLRKITAATKATPKMQDQVCNNDDANGYRLVYIKNLTNAMKEFHKIVCKQADIELSEDVSKRAGLCSHLIFHCLSCDTKVSMSTGKESKGKKASFDINRRAVFAAGEIGIGREALSTMCAVVNMPPPPSLRAYQQHKTAICDATNFVVGKSLSDAAKRVRDSLGANDTDTINIAVSFDGTWSKRGFTANYGIGVVIAVETGEVLDYAVMSKSCEKCKAAEKLKGDLEKYKQWKANHASQGECQKNFEGSSTAMEKEAAKIIWGRSLSKHNFRYTEMVCDGDSKACSEVWDTYGVCEDCDKNALMDKKSLHYQKWLKSAAYTRWENEHENGIVECYGVKKLDCIGHIQKRMGKNLISMQKTGGKLSDGKAVGGRQGRLTRPVIDRLQKYYGNAIRSSVDRDAKSKEEIQQAVEKMQKNIKAVLYHNIKMKEQEKRHYFCPSNSWCTYKNNRCYTDETFVDKPYHLDEVFLEFLLPLFDRLSSTSLLKRCLPGFSQNVNESFNSLIWIRCPKHQNKGIKVVEVATGSAVLQFNVGATGKHALMDDLGIPSGTHTEHGSNKKDQRRIAQSSARLRQKFKRARQVIRQAKLREEERLKRLEGVTYEAGAFNEEDQGPSAAKQRRTCKNPKRSKN